MILWEKLGDGNKKELPLGMCLGTAQEVFVELAMGANSVEMFPAYINVFSATKVVAGKQTELEFILSIGLVQNIKVSKVGLQIRTYFQTISKITILKVGRNDGGSQPPKIRRAINPSAVSSLLCPMSLALKGRDSELVRCDASAVIKI